MQSQLEMLMQQLASQQNELSVLTLFSQEKNRLLARLEALSTGNLISAPSAPAAPSGSHGPGTSNHSPPVPPLVSEKGTDSSWVVVTEKSRPARKVVSTRKYEAATRTFTVNDSPSEFGYLYIPRSHNLNCKNVRSRLRILGINPYNILDIVFPARSVVGLLLHSKYRDQVVNVLAKANIKPLEYFDPLDSSLLDAPKITCKTFDEQQAFVMQLHPTRCCTALECLNYSVAVAVSRSFLEHGFVDEFDVKSSLCLCSNAPAQVHDCPPTEGDQEMADAQSDYSDVL